MTPFKTVCVSMAMVTGLGWSALGLAQSPQDSDINLTGTWKGTRTTTGEAVQEYKIRSIKFELVQKGESLSGSYQCYAGKKATTDCANPVGKVTDGKFGDGQLKIDVQVYPNSYSCSFTGSVAGSKMSGRYSCYAGGTLSSIGVWKASRH